MSDDTIPGGEVSSFTKARRRPSVIGKIQNKSLPFPITLSQVGVGTVGIAVAAFAIWLGVPWLIAITPTAIATLVLGRMVRRVELDDRPFLVGVWGRLRSIATRSRPHPLSRQRIADAICNNVAVGPDYSAWLVLSVQPVPYGGLATGEDRVAAVRIVEQLIARLTDRRWRLASVMATIEPEEVADRMRAASAAPTWRSEVAAETERLRRYLLTQRTFWLMVDFADVTPPSGVAGWIARVRAAVGFAMPARAAWIDTDAAAAMTAALIAGAPPSLGLRPATTSEVAALAERIPGEDVNAEPPEDDLAWLRNTDPVQGSRLVGPGLLEGSSAWRLAQAEWTEPRRGIAVARTDTGSVAHMSAVVSTLPDTWWSPGGGELLWHLDALADQWDWIIDVVVVPPPVARAKAAQQAQSLGHQVEEYDRDPTGAPPELWLAAQQMETERSLLASRSNAAEYHATIVMSTQLPLAGDEITDAEEAELRARLQRLNSKAGFLRNRVVAAAGDQVAARHLWAPNRLAGSRLLVDYRQYVLSDALAGIGPLLQHRLGDPQGAVLGANDERGTVEPVLFDPSLGPRAVEVGLEPNSPALGVVGKLGSGKSVLTKRCMWTVLAEGGQVVVLDRGEKGEYVAFANALADAAPQLRVELIDVTDPAGLGMDPMRVGLDTQTAAKAAVAVISVVAGLDPRGAIAARLQLTAARMRGATITDVIATATAEAKQSAEPGEWSLQGPEWSRVAQLVRALGEDTIGSSVFDPTRRPADLSADLVVLWAPGLALVEQPDSPSDLAASAVVLAMMLIARGMIFRDTSRFAAAVFDEAWSLLKDPRALSVVVEGLRDGRKHNAGIYLVSQSPNDFLAHDELAELLGYIAVFKVAETAVAAACALAGVSEKLAGDSLRSLVTGTCLWRDLQRRVGLVDVYLPAQRAIAEAVDTTPDSQPTHEVVSDGALVAELVG